MRINRQNRFSGAALRTARFLPIVLFALALLAGGCQKKPRIPTVMSPPPALPAPTPTLFEQAEKYFESGNYEEAVRAYEEHLENNSSGQNHDRVLFRLAMAYALPEYSRHDAKRSSSLLSQLVTLYPQSPLRPQAEFILGLHAEVEKLQGIVKMTQAIVTEREARIKELQDANSGSYAEIDKLKTSVKEKDERIRERDNSIRLLKEELEKLKKIDKERRPSRRGQ